ncbi:MAG: PspC domain-containing protein [Gammaproteobacteria bacterium]|nr:PspC domain-containing protein [Gammaproteobacteria bacterium]
MKFNDREKVISRNKLYKNTRKAKFMGVCAGLADFFDTDRHLIRILTIVSALFFTMPTIFVYVVLSVVLPRRPDWSYF